MAIPAQPLYARIEGHFRERIALGRLRAGERLPTEAEIARDTGACRATVQRAMQRLAEAGLVRRSPGAGTFVAERALSLPIDQDHAQFFEEDVEALGGQVGFRLLSFGRVGADAPLAAALGCVPGAEVLRLERQRLLGGRVACLEQRHFPATLRPDFPASALESEPAYRLVEHHLGRRIERLEVALRACIADAALAARLEVDEGCAVMLREHVFVGRGGARLMAGHSYYAGPLAFRYTARRPSGRG